MRFRWLVAALLFVAATLIAAEESRAQACADLVGLTDNVYDFYVDQLDQLPTLGAEACSKLTKGSIAACHKAATSAVRCYQSLYRSTFKAQKIACGATLDPAQCTSDYQSALDGVLDLIDTLSDAVHEECNGSFATDVYFTCLAV